MKLQWQIVVAALPVILLCFSMASAVAGEADAPPFEPPFSVSEKRFETEADIDEVPVFQVRARVVSSKGGMPAANQQSTFALGSYTNPSGKRFSASGDAWTQWVTFDRKLVRASTLAHTFCRNYPVELDILPITLDLPAVIELEAREKEGAPVRTDSVDLFSWGVSLRVAYFTWRDKENQPHFMLRKEFNQSYWDWCKTVAIAEGERPKRFPIMISGSGYHNDSDRFVGLAHMAGLGITAPWFPNPVPQKEDLLHACGLHRIVGRCSRALFDFPESQMHRHYEVKQFLGKQIWYSGLSVPLPENDAWARNAITPYLDMGFKPEEITISPESFQSVWLYPAMFEALSNSPQALQRFRDYIQGQGLTPQDVGAANWDQVLPVARNQAVDLSSRRLFYWTMRFFAWDSARFSAAQTRALEKAAGPSPLAFVAWECPFYENRLYYPGPGGDNPKKTGANTARGACDVLEFGRLRGNSLLLAQSSADARHLAELRCAAEKGGVQFGGAVRNVDEREILRLIGSGGKALRYGVPIGVNEHATYMAYKQDPELPVKMAAVNRIIGKAEDLLWPGKPPRAQVAILAPRSAQLWDKEGAAKVGYMVEESNIYRALHDANIPVDFVEEEDLSPKGLTHYKVLYVTEPNVPAEFQTGVAAWVQAGGILALSTGAGSFDRYNDPCDILSKGLVNTGSGQAVIFTWTPGTFSDAIRDQILAPVQVANVISPVKVNQPKIETPFLLTEKGGAVTLLNWGSDARKEVKVMVRVPFKATSVESVKQGKLNFTQTEDGVTCTLLLGVADVVLLRS